MDEQDSGKRTVKMTEKAMEEHISRQIQARRHKLSQITSLKNHIEQLMEDDANVDTVKNKLCVDFSGLHQEFLELNSGLQTLMNEEEFVGDQRNWFDPKNKSMDDFFWKCEDWMEEVLKRVEQSEECDRQVTPADSRSTLTKVSTGGRSKATSQSGSSHSSASSVRLKAEMEQASLRAKAAALREKLAIEQEEVQLQAQQRRMEASIKARKEMHAMQTALAESDAKMEVLQKYENKQSDGNTVNADDNGQTDIKPTLQPSSRPTLSVPRVKQNRSAATAQQVTSAPKTEIKESQEPVFDGLCQAIAQQANVTEYLVRCHKASLLPDLTIPTFKGDPLEYKSFIRAIEHGIEGRTSDNRDRLQFLLQYTSGQPHELVKSCMHMESSAGYAKAKQMLKEFFGDDFKIAEAYIKEVLDWPTIKSEDCASLQSFALFLTGCANTMTDISYMEDLDNTANIKALANKLPYKLKESWRKFACDLQERTNKRVKFKDFVDFVNRQVKYLLHPIYGNIKENTINTKEPVKQKPKPQYTDTLKSRKVFTTVVVPPKTENEKPTASRTQPVSVDGFSKPCVYCNGEQHSLTVCKKFKSMQHKDKIGFLRSKGLCFACLKHGHMSSSCKQKLQCEECSRPHPTLLHITNKDPRENTGKDCCDQQSVSSALVQMAETGAGKDDCVLSIVPVCVKAQKGTKTVTTYAFLDPGSSATFATESLLNQLNMYGRNVSISLRTMGHESVVNTRIVAGLEISSLDSNQFVELSEVYSQKDIPVSKDNIPRQEDIDS